MRVIAGEFRSRVLKSVPGLDTRPTPDRLRESLFSILAPRLEGCTFLDAFAGTGAVGIEALSRGAARAVFIESNPAALRTLQENIESLGLTPRAQIVRGKASSLIARYGADIVFLDPPYEAYREYDACLKSLAESEQLPSLAIAQHASRYKLTEAYGKLARVRIVRQGDNSLSFYAPAFNDSAEAE